MESSFAAVPLRMIARRKGQCHPVKNHVFSTLLVLCVFCGDFCKLPQETQKDAKGGRD
jgi:hypothetical protein